MKKKNTVERNLRRLQHTVSGRYLTFVIAFLVLGAAFLTSSAWLPAMLPKTIAEANKIGDKQQMTATTTLTLLYWDYAADAGSMEIGLSSNTIDDLSKYTTVAATGISDKVRTPVTAKLVGCWDEKIFITLSDIPQKFDRITVELHGADEASGVGMVQFSCNSQVHRVDKPARNTETDYRLYAVDLSLKETDQQVQEYTDEIARRQKEVHEQEDEIAELERQKQFQTDSERRATEARQATMESDKNTLIFSITDLFDARRELYEKQKLENLRT